MAYLYKTVKIGGKTKLLHRHLMEMKLGRPLSRLEQVHHINGNRHDNSLENLELLPRQEHQRLHKQKHPLEKRCAVCGATFIPPPTKRERAQTCEKACAYKLRWKSRRKVQLELGLSGAA